MFCIVCPTISHRKFQSHFILKNDESHDIHMTSSIWFLRISENAHHVPFIWSPQCLFLISPCLPMNIDENPMVIMANAHIMDDFPHYLILLPSYHPKVPLYLVIFPWVCHSSKSLKKKKKTAPWVFRTRLLAEPPGSPGSPGGPEPSEFHGWTCQYMGNYWDFMGSKGTPVDHDDFQWIDFKAILLGNELFTDKYRLFSLDVPLV